MSTRPIGHRVPTDVQRSLQWPGAPGRIKHGELTRNIARSFNVPRFHFACLPHGRPVGQAGKGAAVGMVVGDVLPAGYAESNLGAAKMPEAEPLLDATGTSATGQPPACRGRPAPPANRAAEPCRLAWGRGCL